MDEGNYGPSIPVGPTKVPPRGYWKIHQAPGAVEYMWADAVMSTAELFSEDDDFATPLAITSLHLKVHEAADTRRKRRLQLLDRVPRRSVQRLWTPDPIH
jgi:hypothetical protein